MTITRTTIIITVLTMFAAIIFTLLSIDVAHAQCEGQGGFVPLECFKGSRKLEGAYYEGDLGKFINRVFVGAIALGAILAVLRLAWAGFVYLSSDLWTNKDHAKEIIRETLLGLFLLLGIWLILYQINPDILKLKVDFNSAGSGAVTYPSDPGGLSPFAPASSGSSGSTQPPPSNTFDDLMNAPRGHWCYSRGVGEGYLCYPQQERCVSAASNIQAPCFQNITGAPPAIQPKPPVDVPPSPPNQFCFVVEASGEQICRNSCAECKSSRTAHPSSTLTPCMGETSSCQ